MLVVMLTLVVVLLVVLIVLSTVPQAKRAAALTEMVRAAGALAVFAAIIAAISYLWWIPVALAMVVGERIWEDGPQLGQAIVGGAAILIAFAAVGGSILMFLERCPGCKRRKFLIYNGPENDPLCTRCRKAAVQTAKRQYPHLQTQAMDKAHSEALRDATWRTWGLQRMAGWALLYLFLLLGTFANRTLFAGILLIGLALLVWAILRLARAYGWAWRPKWTPGGR